MTMRVGHAEAVDGVALEVELDQHDRFLADDPAVVARFDRDDLRRLVLDDAAVGVFDVNLAARGKPTCACMQRSVPVTGFVSLPSGSRAGRSSVSPARRLKPASTYRKLHVADVDASLSALHLAQKRSGAVFEAARPLLRRVIVFAPCGLLLAIRADTQVEPILEDSGARAHGAAPSGSIRRLPSRTRRSVSRASAAAASRRFFALITHRVAIRFEIPWRLRAEEAAMRRAFALSFFPAAPRGALRILPLLEAVDRGLRVGALLERARGRRRACDGSLRQSLPRASR